MLTEKNDPVFDSILNRLQAYVLQLPEYLPDERVTSAANSQVTQHLSYKKLLQKLIDSYHKGQSRVGFLQEIMLYFNDPVLAKGRQYKAPIQDEILRYLSTQPSMAMILQDYRQYVNEPSRNGFSWLHQAMMTHEKHVVWWLMQQYQANPNLQPLFRTKVVNEQQAKQSENKVNIMIRGTGEETNLLNLDEDVEIVESRFVHSYPAHYAAMLDDVELYSWLQQHGANMALAAGNGKTPRQMMSASGNIGANDGPRQSGTTGHISVFSLFPSLQAVQDRQAERLRNQHP